MREVLVVHCVDAEGPLGGDARRNPDGTAEFYDNWRDILTSLEEITRPEFRIRQEDSFGGWWRYSWFTLDFQGFATNPKQRDTAPHAVYDHLRQLYTVPDSFEFHHHPVPPDGAGDKWTRVWDPTPADEQLGRMGRDRGRYPHCFRAGGTIETNEMSGWIERRFFVDFSNRVSERSREGNVDLNTFDWFGAPGRWGCYRPSEHDFLQEGSMHRLIYRCVDLRSRYNELSADHVDEAFEQTAREDRPSVLSFFSHDNRDMRSETRWAHKLIVEGAERHGVPWRSCTAMEAHRLHHARQAVTA